MDENKRMIDGCKVLHTVRLDGVEHIVATNPEDSRPYRLYEARRDNILGVSEARMHLADSDYLKVMREFVRVLAVRTDSLDLDRVYRGTPLMDFPVTEKECVLGGMDEDMTGAVIAIRQEMLSPEYRTQSHQLHIATGGFGCLPEASGRAIYCTNLYSGEQTRFAREDMLGVLAEDILPGWAKTKLAALRRPPERESVLEKIHEAKAHLSTPPKSRQRDKDAPGL
jgi:hypothetical protein